MITKAFANAFKLKTTSSLIPAASRSFITPHDKNYIVNHLHNVINMCRYQKVWKN